MKNSFKLFGLFLAIGMAASFTACSDDDDNGGDSSVEYITENTTWYNDEVHTLDKRTVVNAGVTLTIEEGTVVKGASGTGTNAKALIITKGAKIYAVGTKELPIIFTSTADDITPEDVKNGNIAGSVSSTTNSQWGGILILGEAPISVKGGATTAQIEGIPSTSEYGQYGGTDATDNSGEFKYVSIRHGGADIGEGNEINGLSLGGVGSGTQISHIEIVANLDDGIEFFGGTVNISDVVVWNVGDDGLDTDQGWKGTCSNFVVLTPGNNLLELDGIEGDKTDKATVESFGYHTFENGYLVADTAKAGDLMNLDPETSVHFDNLYYTAIDVNNNLITIDSNHIINMQDLKDGTEKTLANFLDGVDTQFKDVVLNVASADLNNYIDGSLTGLTATGNAGVSAGTAPVSSIDVSAFSGWSWAASAATAFPASN
jgi:hypothetical protein